jgi:hypothetical protein
MSELRNFLEYFVKYHPEVANDVFFALEDIFLQRKSQSDDSDLNILTSSSDPEGFVS